MGGIYSTPLQEQAATKSLEGLNLEFFLLLGWLPYQ